MNDSDKKPSTLPHLVVKFSKEGDTDQYEWGITGQVPILELIGYLHRVQTELAIGRYSACSCDEPHLLIEWDAKVKTFFWEIGHNANVNGLVGILETIKLLIVGAHTQRQMEQRQRQQTLQPTILGPTGQPWIRG